MYPQQSSPVYVVYKLGIWNIEILPRQLQKFYSHNLIVQISGNSRCIINMYETRYVTCLSEVIWKSYLRIQDFFNGYHFHRNEFTGAFDLSSKLQQYYRGQHSSNIPHFI